MRLLVTGGAGFIGSNFVRYWVEHHPDDVVVAYDVLTYAGNRPNLAYVEDRIVFVQGDIGDLEVVAKTLAEHEIDVIVNFAAESHNSLAILDPSRFFRTNVLGTQTLAEAARRHGVSRFHHISTCEVYGDLPLDSDEMFTEETPYRPRTPYNASKAGADHAVRAYAETFGLPATITNCGNNYGPYQFPEKVIPLFTAKALDDQPLPLYASTQNRREWLHVEDHCRAIELVLQHGVVGETYNVGSGVGASTPEGTANWGGTSGTCWPGASRTGEGPPGPPAPPGSSRRSTRVPSTCSQPTSTPWTWSTGRRSGRSSTRSGRTSCCTRGPTPRWTPARPIPTPPSPSMPSAPGTWPRRPGLSTPTWSTSRPTTCSTAP